MVGGGTSRSWDDSSGLAKLSPRLPSWAHTSSEWPFLCYKASDTSKRSLDLCNVFFRRNIRISMRKSDMHITVPALREALDSCPNIKVVSIFRAEAAKATTDLFKSYFNDRSYFSIETVMVPKSARGLLQACPNIKKLIWSGRGGPELFQTLAHIPTGTHRDIGSSLIVFVGLPEIDHTIINWESWYHSIVIFLCRRYLTIAPLFS